LVESEEARLEEKKEAEYKPVVMGKENYFLNFYILGKFLNLKKSCEERRQ